MARHRPPGDETAADRFDDRVAAVLDGDHEVLPGEQHDLAGDQLGPGLVVVQRLEHDEEAFVVDVKFGALVGVDRVLDRERVRSEVEREVVELVVGRLAQPEPDEAARCAAALRMASAIPTGSRVPLEYRAQSTSIRTLWTRISTRRATENTMDGFTDLFCARAVQMR
jgi:hypothetical protein